jgi:hypothetical protein
MTPKDLERATAGIYDVQDGDVFRTVMSSIADAGDRMDDPRLVLEQLVLALVFFSMSYNLNFKSVRRLIGIYRMLLLHMIETSGADA